MTVSLSFSGGISHSKDLPEQARLIIAQQIALAVREAVANFYVSGSGCVSVGSEPFSFTVSPKEPLPEK